SEQLARALAIAARDNRSVHIDRVAFLKELMDRKREPAPGAEHGAKQIRPRPQMPDGAKKLQRVPLLLEWIGSIGLTDQLNPLGPQFPFLAGSGGGDQTALDGYGGAGGEASHIAIARSGAIDDDLKITQARAVVQFQKRKPFCVPACPDPTLNAKVVLWGRACQSVFNQRAHV